MPLPRIPRRCLPASDAAGATAASSASSASSAPTPSRPRRPCPECGSQTTLRNASPADEVRDKLRRLLG